MSTIKYLTFAVIASLALNSCQFGKEEISEAPDSASAITITVESVEDNACAFTLAPQGASNYYSYALVKTSSTSLPDAEALYKGNVSAVKKGTFKYSDKEKASVSVSKLEKDSDYVIFAVAGSPMGIPGEVVARLLHTTDVTKPVLNAKTVTIQDDVLTLPFNEDVKYVDGKVIRLDVYAPKSWDYLYYGTTAEIRSTVEVSSATVSGSTISIEIPEGKIPSGALVAVSYGKGSFVDLCGNECDAYESVCVGEQLNADKTALVIGDKGLVVTVEAGSFELGENTVTEISSIEEPVALFAFDFGYILSNNRYYYGVDPDGGEDPEAVGSIEYFQWVEPDRLSSKKVDLLPQGYSEDSPYYGISQGYGFVALCETPAAGDSIRVVVPAGAYIDEYGNYSKQSVSKVLFK